MEKWKTKIYLYGLIFVVFCSLCFHISFRNEHFQEIDSDVVYYALNHFNEFAYQYTAFPTREGSLDQLHKGYRRQLIEVVSAMNLPEWFKGFFVIPYSTTYSPMPGLIYSVLNLFFRDYNSFLSAGMVLMQILFHLSVILLFFLLQQVQISKAVSFLVSILFLFSVTHYSYAYNLGSPNWTMLTAMMWLSVFAFSSPEKRDLHISWATSVLIFFSYLTLIYWLGFLLLKIIKEKRLFRVFINQYVAIFFIAVCALIFVQPGQGERGVAVYLSEMHQELAYILVNFSAWFTSENLFIPQLVLTLVPLMALMVHSFLRKRSGEADVVVQLNLAILFCYLFFVSFNGLPFLASRHMLFLSPVFFLFLAKGFEVIFSVLGPRSRELGGAVLTMALVVLSPISLRIRTNEVKDRLKTEVTRNVPNLILLDSRFEFPHNAQKTWISIPAFGIGLNNFYELKPGQKYTYLSQWLSLDNFIAGSELYREKTKAPTNKKLQRSAKILRQEKVCDLKSFIAYERFRYGFQKSNCRYFYEFEVVNGKEIVISKSGETH